MTTGAAERLHSAAACGKAGAQVADCTLPPRFAQLADAQRWVSAYEGARSLAYEATVHRARLSPDILEGRIRDGEACSPELKQGLQVEFVELVVSRPFVQFTLYCPPPCHIRLEMPLLQLKMASLDSSRQDREAEYLISGHCA